jgi:hypothetical protein
LRVMHLNCFILEEKEGEKGRDDDRTDKRKE